MALSSISIPKSLLPLTKTPIALNKPGATESCSKKCNSIFHGTKISTSTNGFAPFIPQSRPRRMIIVAGKVYQHSDLVVWIVGTKVSKGSVPPSFNLKDQDGKMVSLSKFKGKPTVVYFYPADDSPGCTKEACAFRDSYEKFKKAGAEVIGISADSPDSHKAFAKKYRLPFTLLSDEGNRVRKEWGVPGDFFGSLPGRETYVLDKKGVVQLVYNNQFQPEKHVEETLQMLNCL